MVFKFQQIICLYYEYLPNRKQVLVYNQILICRYFSHNYKERITHPSFEKIILAQNSRYIYIYTINRITILHSLIYAN